MHNPSYIIEPCQKNTETLLVFMSNMHSSKYLQKMNDEEAGNWNEDFRVSLTIFDTRNLSPEPERETLNPVNIPFFPLASQYF